MTSELKKNKKKALCISLGCFKNRVDSERIAYTISESGYEITDSVTDYTELCVVNTCGFLEEAVRENIDMILDLTELKESGRVGKIVVFGCLYNRYGDDLSGEIPEVDSWIKCEDYEGLASLISADVLRKETSEPPGRYNLTPDNRHTRYLKIAEGCDNRCSYCAIPNIRGDLASLPLDFLLREAEMLISEGTRELCLVCQDLTAYGRDIGLSLQGLLAELDKSLPRDTWVRLLYLQPAGIDNGLLEFIAGSRHILPYLDIPIQHASERILALMNRPIASGDLLNIFTTARNIRPDFALRTTCMTGFPSESREDFKALLRFVETVQFDRLGTFVYSPEEGTAAALMGDQIARRTQNARRERLMQLQDAISLQRQSLFMGKTMTVLVDGFTGNGTAECRSYREAPEVDGIIEVKIASNHIRAGDFMQVKITETYEHDMLADEVTG